MLFADFEISEISERVKKEIFSKRESTYSPEAVSKRYNISIQDAKKIVEDRKSKTKGTLENFIKRHGEEDGKKKFAEFCQKSSHTKEKYIKKYGVDGLAKWEEYIKTKGKSKQNYIEEFGAIEGNKKWEEVLEKRRTGSSKAGIISKHGADYYENMSKARSFSLSLDGYIDKYGRDDGIKLWKEYCKKKDSRSFSSILTKINDFELAKSVYHQKTIECSPIYQGYKKIYGENVAKEKYKSYKSNSIDYKEEISLSIKKTKPYLRSKRRCVSGEANKFFAELEESLGREIRFGRKGNELKLFNEEFGRVYYYDCFDELSNTIIEFNGVGFHPRDGQEDFIHIANGKSYKECRDKDLQKINFAKSLGYNLHIVWSDEVKRKHNRIEKIDFLKKEMVSNVKN